MNPETSKSLVDRAKDGDREATEQVLRKLRRTIEIKASLMAKVSGIPREDLIQEGWLGAIIALRQVDTSIGDPICFLALRARWAILNATRNSQRHQTYLTIVDDIEDGFIDLSNHNAICPVSDRDDPAEQAIISQLIPIITEKIKYEKRQRIFKLLMLGYKQSEIAVMMKESSANLCYHVNIIRTIVRAIVNEEGQP